MKMWGIISLNFESVPKQGPILGDRLFSFNSVNSLYILTCSVESDNKISPMSRLGMSVTTQCGSGRQYVTGTGRNISKYRLVLLNVYRFWEN